MPVSRVSRLLKGRPVTDSVLVTAWDAGNTEGDALSEAMMSTLRMLLHGAGADLHGMPPQPGSICCDCPDGTVLLGPVTDPALTMEVVPQDDSAAAAPPPAAAKSGKPQPQPQAPSPKTSPKKTAAGTSSSPAVVAKPAVAKPPAPRVLQLNIHREGSGVVVDLSRRKPLVDVVVKRPATPKGDWVTIKVLASSSGAATGSKKGGKVVASSGGATPSSSGGAASKPTDGAAITNPIAAGPVEAPRPTYRGTHEAAAMQQAMRFAAGGFREQPFLFHSGRPAWRQAVAAAAQRG